MKSREEFAALLKQKQDKRIADEKAHQEYTLKKAQVAVEQMLEFVKSADLLLAGQKLDGEFKLIIDDNQPDTIRFFASSKNEVPIPLLDVVHNGCWFDIHDNHKCLCWPATTIEQAIEKVASVVTDMTSASIYPRKTRASLRIF